MIADGTLDQAALATALADGPRRAGLPDPEVTVRVARAIARHPDTGKASRFIPAGTDDDAHREED